MIVIRLPSESRQGCSDPEIEFAYLGIENLFRSGQIRADVAVMEPNIRRKTYDYGEIIGIELNQFYKCPVLAEHLFCYAKHPPNISQADRKWE